MAQFSITQSNPKREKIYLYPESDVSSCTEWTAHGESQNWACVDEDRDSPDYLTTYVSMATDTDTLDQYSLPNATLMVLLIMLKFIPEYGLRHRLGLL